MTVDGISSSSASYLEQLLAASQVSSSGSAGDVEGNKFPPPPPMDESTMSSLSELMSELESLQETDSEQYTEAVNSIAEKLKAAAEEEDDEQTSQMLSDLAEKFSDAAESGDISDILPPPPPPPPGGQATMNGYTQYSGENSDDYLSQLLGETGDRSSPFDDFNSTISGIFEEALAAL